MIIDKRIHRHTHTLSQSATSVYHMYVNAIESFLRSAIFAATISVIFGEPCYCFVLFSPFWFRWYTNNNYTVNTFTYKHQLEYDLLHNLFSMWIVFSLDSFVQIFVIFFISFFAVHLHELFAHSIDVYAYKLSRAVVFSSVVCRATAISSRSTNSSINTKSATYKKKVLYVYVFLSFFLLSSTSSTSSSSSVLLSPLSFPQHLFISYSVLFVFFFCCFCLLC